MKGGQVTLNQLAEQWLMRSGKIFQSTYSRDIYISALKEAQQFMWAGPEMDPVSSLILFTSQLVSAANFYKVFFVISGRR